MAAFLKDEDAADEVRLIVQATQFLMQRIDTDLWAIVEESLQDLQRQISCVGA